jgi:hypothetical protein
MEHAGSDHVVPRTGPVKQPAHLGRVVDERRSVGAPLPGVPSGGVTERGLSVWSDRCYIRQVSSRGHRTKHYAEGGVCGKNH